MRSSNWNPELSISILDCPLTELVNFLTKPCENISLHIDLIDTSYCPNISFGLNQTMEIIELSKLKPIDLHCMFKLSENLIGVLDSILAKHNRAIRTIYIQVPSKREFIKFFKKYYSCLLVKYEIEDIGLAIDPGFCIQDFKELCQFLNDEGLYISVLLMTVKAGIGKQSFYYGNKESGRANFRRSVRSVLYSLVDKIKKLNVGLFKVGVDGGINLENFSDLPKNINFIVIGSAFHNSNCKEDFIQRFQQIIDSKTKR